MSEYTKKNYIKLKNIIEKNYDIEIIEFKNKDALSSGSSSTFFGRKINIGLKDNWEIIIACLSHEFGHCLLSINKQSIKKSIYTLYRMGVVSSEKNAKKIISEEREAWRLGFKFLKQNKIKPNDYLKNIRKILINHHIKTIKKYLKLLK